MNFKLGTPIKLFVVRKPPSLSSTILFMILAKMSILSGSVVDRIVVHFAERSNVGDFPLNVKHPS